MKLKLITKQLFRNYIFVMAIIISLGLSAYTLNKSYVDSQINKTVFDTEIFLFDYPQGLDYALSNQNLEENDYLLIFDNSYKVLDVYNYDLVVGQQLDVYEFQAIYDSNQLYHYLFTDDDEKYQIILYLAPLEKNTLLIVAIISIATLLFFVFTIVLATRTGKNIIRPLNLIRDGVHEISKGNYDHVIQFETGNEMEHIRDDINLLSNQLKTEISRRKKLEAQRNQLILSLSHDIKTPLTNVIGYSQMLLQQENLDKNIKPSLEIIHKYGLTAAQLSDELFDYTKLNNNDQHLQTSAYDVVELIRIKLIEYVNEFESLNITYSLELPNHPITCQIHLTSFNRVLDNLLQNSIRYNHQDFNIHLAVFLENQDVKICLSDNGIGIPLAYHETIFDPMVRVESSRNRNLGGTGLGLSIAKQIMLNHAGDIIIDSSYSDGAMFILTLPKDKTPQ